MVTQTELWISAQDYSSEFQYVRPLHTETAHVPARQRRPVRHAAQNKHQRTHQQDLRLARKRKPLQVPHLRAILEQPRHQQADLHQRHGRGHPPDPRAAGRGAEGVLHRAQGAGLQEPADRAVDPREGRGVSRDRFPAADRAEPARGREQPQSAEHRGRLDHPGQGRRDQLPDQQDHRVRERSAV